MTQINLSELLDTSELGQVANLLQYNKNAELYVYLNEPNRRLRLLGKGIGADDLYFQLLYEKHLYLAKNN